MRPEVSVVVPAYNIEKYLERCVESILAQTFADLEILLVDDGSKDQSGALCDVYAEKDCRIRVIHKANGGLSDARNAGTEKARGNWICYIDGDDFIDPDMIRVLHTMARKEQAQISVCGVMNCYESHCQSQYPEVMEFACSGQEALKLTLEGTKMPGSVCNKLIAMDLAKKMRFPVGKTYEDAFYMPGLLLSAQRVAVTTRPLYHYWHREGSITTVPFSPRKMDVIDAYRYTLDVVKEKCPSLIPQGEFRLMWAYFTVLDSMLFAENYQKLPQYPEVVRFLKKNWSKALHCTLFRGSRRVSALALKCNVRLYRLLSLLSAKRTKVSE